MPVLAPWVPELSALELLLTVAGEGSLGRAAAIHGVSQPAVSSRIKGLERQLGFALLERGARGSSLTPRGALVAEWARGVVDAAASLEAGIAAVRADSQARLTVAASLTVAEYLLPGWLAQWRARQPDIQINLIGINSAAAARLVLDGKVDLGFIEGPKVPPGLSSRIIGHDRLVVVAAPDHPWSRRRKPIEPRELAATPLVQREPGSGTRVALEHALRGNDIAAPALELSTASAVRGAAAAGAAPTVASAYAIGDDLRAHRLVEIPVTCIDLSRQLRAIWPRGQRLTGPARDLLSLITRSVPGT